MSDTPALVVCDAAWIPHCGYGPHAEDRDCINPRPAATIELPTSSAPQIEGRCLVRVFEGDHWGAVYRACNAKIPCAAHPAPPKPVVPSHDCRVNECTYPEECRGAREELEAAGFEVSDDPAPPEGMQSHE